MSVMFVDGSFNPRSILRRLPGPLSDVVPETVNSVRNARRRYSVSRDGVLAAPVAALQVFADLSPALRLQGLQRLPQSFRAGAVGAEVATWGAVSPSLLPHNWFATAMNVGVLQGIGHGAATAVAQAVRPGKQRASGPLPRPARLAMTGVTLGMYGTALWRRNHQEELVEVEGEYSVWDTLGGLALGTVGYGAVLAIGEVIQSFVDAINSVFGKKLPPVTSWPLAIAVGGGVILLFTDRLVIRQFLSLASRQAAELDRAFMRGADQPTEPERSGSPDSIVDWSDMGRQGRATVAGGPRKSQIERVLGGDEEAMEPIRIVIGLHGLEQNESPDFEAMAQEAISEMHRTGAFERSHIAIMSGAGTGWVNDFHTSGLEFVTRGDCAVVSMQYSFLPSAYSYIADHESPVRSSRILARAIQEELSRIDEASRPKLYVGGESLGAYGVSDAFESVEEFMKGTSGGVFTGVPGFAKNHRELTRRREAGSPERLPLVDGGRHARFVAHPDHLEHDFQGDAYANEWESPRYVFAQHASDPVVWWEPSLLWKAPDWLTEPGSRGQKAPDAQKLDVLQTLRWMPLVTFWQVGVDQLMSQEVPSPHGHNYHDETVAYWNAVIHGPGKGLSADQLARASEWIHNDAVKLRKPPGGFPSKYGY
ncbi:alpha/beta-hydrolase family protein [Corynebacterium sp. TA-R-1]|uniref:Alpha/beta-hydrolase family protein n=1 Tax=Corynebacterium stercoris TaxID=2943490 RepID=A0ABT1G0G0_9CORY|nr:alpha/beta-hydrolase family protein [Corynebacterium stercoris]MCP1387501.1 alpha/beta-hydrolase family protein [Corynebacterium stercoris]